MSAPIKIDYDPDTNRFLVFAPFWALGLCRGIPNRKFEKRLNNAWTAPALRANIEYLENMSPTQTEFTPAARQRISQAQDKSVEVPFPNDYVFKTEPYAHQQLALNKSYSAKAFAYFMDMRTGKTKVVIDRSMAMFYNGLLNRHVIIPLKTLRRNWGSEFAIHAHASDYSIHYLESGDPKAYSKWESTTKDKLMVLLVGIESLSAGKSFEMVMHFLRGDKCRATIDESDTIKNHKAIRTERVFEIREKAQYRDIMTGTPISEGPMDFFAQFEFVDPNIIGIGDFYSFRNRYAIMGGWEDKEVIGYQNMPELTELVRPYVYQVRYSEVFDSPAAVSEIRTVQLSDRQREIYGRLKKDNTIRYENDPKKIALVVQNILEKMLRFQEVCGGNWSERVYTGEMKKVWKVDPETRARRQIEEPAYKFEHHVIPGENPKIEEMTRALVHDYKDDQAVIWSIFRPEISAIAARLSKYGTVAEFHGDVSEDERDRIDKDFKAGKIKWIVANPTTGGRGYTFDAAGVLCYFSCSHSYIHRKQSAERATSSKKIKPVVIIDIVAEQTVDEIVHESLREKNDIADFVRSRFDRRTGLDDLVS